MRLPSVRAFLFATVAASIAIAPPIVHAQLPNIARPSTQAPPVPTVMRPAEGQVVTGDLAIAVQVPAGVPARKYTIEAAYWDPAGNTWVYPGTLGADFAGGTTASARVAADVRHKYNANATRWRIHVRTTEPAGGWGPWREFTWQDAPPPQRTADTSQPTPAPTPTNTAAPGAPSTPPSTNVPAVQGERQPPSGTTPPAGQGGASGTGTMVPGPPGTSPGPPDSRTAPAPAAPGTARTQPAPPPVVTRAPSPQPPPAPTGTPAPQPVVPPTTAPGSTPSTPPRRTPPPPMPPLPTSVTQPPITARPPVPSATARAPRATTDVTPSQAIAEQGKPVKIVSSTTLQVWDGKATVDNVKYFVDGPVDVDWAKKTLTWWFKYTTTAPNAAPAKARWEMSRAPFPQWGMWEPYPGFGYAGPANGTRFPIDLNPYAPRPEGWVPSVKVGGPPQNVGQAKAAGGGGADKPPTLSQASSLPSDLKIPQPGKAGSGGMVSTIPAKLPASLSLYVRVVPLDKNGKDADVPSNFVELRFGPAEKAPPFNLDPKVWPQIAFVSYRPVQGYTFDWQCWVKAAEDIKAPAVFNLGVNPGTQDNLVILFHKGETRNSCDKDDGGIVGDIVDAIGGFVELFKDFVNGVSGAFDSIKTFAASTIASAIPGCSGNSLCEGAIMTGINAGLVALGVPPDLPDFDQLQAMGEDYLAETIAQQVAAQTGLPGADAATKAAVKKMIDEGKKAAQSGGNGSSLWIPDDAHQYKPLLVIVSASNPGTGSAAAMYLEINDTGTRYNPAKVAIPSLSPGESFKIAIALQPTKDPKAWMGLLPTDAEYQQNGLAEVMALIVQKHQLAHDALKAWRAEYLAGMVTFRARLTLPPFVGKQVFEKSCMADKPACLVQ